LAIGKPWREGKEKIQDPDKFEGGPMIEKKDMDDNPCAVCRNGKEGAACDNIFQHVWIGKQCMGFQALDGWNVR
jgi:hypothetical protein